jgi:hypothetical protein
MGMRVVILVPRRDGVRDRDILWAWCRQWWRDRFPEWVIFEGHHDDGPFNRSCAVNRASGSADWQQPEPWDVAVIIDSDVICDPDRVRASVAKAAASGRLTIPFDVRHDLSLPGSAKVMAGYPGDWTRFIRRTYTEMVSSVIAVPRSLWDDVAGFDEGFAGWGFEDNAFAAACETFGGPIERIPGELWHLYHDPAREGKRGTATHQRNKTRADRYLAVRGDREATRALRATGLPAFEHHPVGIPRILHRVVPERIDSTAERWWAEFARLHPDWELRTHRDPLRPEEWPETSPYWDRCRNGAELADLVRLEALLRWGGVYVDEDVEPFRPLDALVPLSAFAAWEDERTVPNAVMGAVPNHPAIRACLDLAIDRIALSTWERGPGVTTSVFPGRHDVLLFPPGTFYAVHYRDLDRERLMADPALRKRNPWAFVLHHYAGSWLAPSA